MKPHVAAAMETRRKLLIFKNPIWSPGSFASHPFLFGENALFHMSPRRQALPRASFQKQAIPTWALGEFVSPGFPGRHSRSALLAELNEVCAFGMHCAGSGNQVPFSRPPFPYLSDAATVLVPSMSNIIDLKPLISSFPQSSVLAEFSHLNSDPVLCL